MAGKVKQDAIIAVHFFRQFVEKFGEDPPLGGLLVHNQGNVVKTGFLKGIFDGVGVGGRKFQPRPFFIMIDADDDGKRFAVECFYLRSGFDPGQGGQGILFTLNIN